MTGIDVTHAQAWLQWVIIGGAVIGTLTALGVFIRKLWRLNQSIVAGVHWITVDLPTRLDRQDEALADIRHEVQYNNGSSVKDAIKRVEERSERVEAGIKGLYKRADTTDLNAQKLRDDIENPKPATPRRPKKETP